MVIFLSILLVLAQVVGNLWNMPRDAEQRAVIKFLVAQGHTQVQVYRQLQTVYGEETMSRTQTRHWWLKFKEGDGLTPTADVAHPGCPKDPRRQQLVNKVQEMITADARLTIRQLSRRTGAGFGTVQRILKELNMSKIAAKFVPKLLTPEQQQQQRLEAGRMNLALLEEDPLLLSKIVTGDES